MKEIEGTAELAQLLVTFAARGIYEVLGEKSPLEVSGVAMRAITLRDVQASADAFPDKNMQMRIQARLGLNPYAGLSQRDRNDVFAKTFPNRRKYSSLPRSDQNRPLRLLARQLMSDATLADEPSPSVRDAVGVYDRWDVLEYEVDHSFPGAAGGHGVQVHRRLIRSNVDTLTQFRITQKSNWPSGGMPEYQMLSAGDIHVEKTTATVEGGEPGYRFDLVIDIPSVELGHLFELKWMRTYDFQRGDLGREGDTGSVDLSPITVVQHADIRVRFSRDLVPSRVWKISGVPSIDRTEVPIVTDSLALRSNAVSVKFSNIPVGYSVGVGWRW